MTINNYIAQYKKQDENSGKAIFSIYNELKPFINYISNKYPIPGKDIDDLHSFALEQIFDCLNERELKRGTGMKKTLSENDNEVKNLNFLKNAIKYKFIRERRRTESNVKYSFNIEILDDNENKYLDRNNKPLDIGINFVHNIPYLYEGKKRTNVILNLPVVKNNRTVISHDFADPLDNSLSFDFKVDNGTDDDCELKDVLEYEYQKSNRDTSFDNFELRDIINNIKKCVSINEKQLRTINDIIKNSYSTSALKEYVKENKNDVNSIKKHLKLALEKLEVL